MVKVYMSCVVYTPQTPVLDNSDQLQQYRNLQPEYYLIMWPHRVPVRDLKRPGFLSV